MSLELYRDDTVAEMQHNVHKTAVEHGWWEDKDNTVIPEKLALIHSEISEALEEYRKGRIDSYQSEGGKPEGFGVELADAVIRIFDLAAFLGIDMGLEVALKHNFNLTRSYKHGGKVC